MFGALWVVMDTLEHSGFTAAGKCAILEAAGGNSMEVLFENAETFVRLKRALRALRLSTLQQEVVLSIAGRWVGGEWPPLRSILRAQEPQDLQ
jgi:hypothetical protein